MIMNLLLKILILNCQSNQIFNKRMSLKAFEDVAHYDICIANYLSQEINDEEFPKILFFKKTK